MKKGYSFIEVLVVVGIIGVLSAIVIPAYIKYVRTTAQESLLRSTRTVVKALENCLILNNIGNCSSLDQIGVNCPNCTKFQVRIVPTAGIQFCLEQSIKSFNICLKGSQGGTSHGSFAEVIKANFPIPCSKLSYRIFRWPTDQTWTNAGGSSCRQMGCNSIQRLPPVATTSPGFHTISCATRNPTDVGRLNSVGECRNFNCR